VPNPQARRLFLLHREGRVLGDAWAGWRVHADRIVDPEGGPPHLMRADQQFDGRRGSRAGPAGQKQAAPSHRSPTKTGERRSLRR
jgi:hypothetical protein